MTIEIKQVDMIFAKVRFASDARETMHINRYTAEEVAIVAGVSDTSVKTMLSGQHGNPEMKTFLGICNALDLNPIDYFDLAE